MGAERSSIGAARGGRLRRWRALAFAATGVALALGCFAQKPAGEGAPSAPQAPPAKEQPEPATAAPLVLPQTPPGEPREKKKQGEGAAPGKGAAPETQRLAPRAPRREPEQPASRRGSAASRPAEDSELEIGGDTSDAPALRQRLESAYRAGSPDCPAARDRKKAVCDLATQICQLTDRDPNVASVAEYCSEAKQRCSEAERRTLERCAD